MRTATLIARSCAIIAIAALVNTAVTRRAAACSCVPPTVESSYNNSTDVVIAEIRREFVLGNTRYYLARVERTYKGCLDKRDRILLSTPVSGASCGADLSARRHLINGNAAGSLFGLPVFSINLCGYNLPAADLTAHDLEFLNGRTVCCGDACTCADGTQPVLCFADPCSVAPACDEGKCVANFCGGCNAEFYDPFGNAVCEAQSECISDEDCPAGEWCRQAQSSDPAKPIYECVPFVGEGASCGGFRPPWTFERCQPKFICDLPDFVADAPGICRPECKTDGDCAADEYCASDHTCDRDGACEVEIDCNLPGNSYAHIECVGHGTCSQQGQCGWVCESPQCIDLDGYDFGPCDAVLGWGVEFDVCAELSGCSSPFTLFGTEAECRRACGM